MYFYARETWRGLVAVLPWWNGLSLAQRRTALELPDTYHAPFAVFDSLEFARRKDLFEENAQGRRRVSPGFRRLIAFIRKLADWSGGAGVDTGHYVLATTSLEQRQALTGLRSGTPSAVLASAFRKRLLMGEFSRRVLASPDFRAFLADCQGWTPESGEGLSEAAFQGLRAWTQGAVQAGNTLYELTPEAFAPEGTALDPGGLLHLAIAYGIVIPVLSHDSLTPCFLVPKPAAEPEFGPEKIVRIPAESRESFARPFLIDDIEAILRALRSQPAPVLSNGFDIPLAHQRKLAKAFLPLPAWIPERAREPEARAGMALWAMFRLELCESQGNRRKDWRLGIGPRGRGWLGKPRAERLAGLLQVVPMGTRQDVHELKTFGFLGDFALNPFPYAAATSTVFDWLECAFAQTQAPSAWEPFVRDAVAAANPFLADAAEKPELDARWQAWDASPEEVYRDLVHRYAGALAALGALAFGINAKGGSMVAPTPIGAWLFGRADSWTLPEAPKAQAVVGADFTVTLLGSDPESRAELSAFCEEAGAAFRITRAAVQAAAHGGRTAESMLATLTALSKHALPANVVHEIKAWAGARKTVSAIEAIVVQGDDPLTLAEIKAAWPQDFIALSPQALMYQGKSTRAALMARLAKKGFFPAY